MNNIKQEEAWTRICKMKGQDSKIRLSFISLQNRESLQIKTSKRSKSQIIAKISPAASLIKRMVI